MAAFLRGGVWSEATLRGTGLEVEPLSKHSRLFRYMDARDWSEVSTKKFLCLPSMKKTLESVTNTVKKKINKKERKNKITTNFV